MRSQKRSSSRKVSELPVKASASETSNSKAVVRKGGVTKPARRQKSATKQQTKTPANLAKSAAQSSTKTKNGKKAMMKNGVKPIVNGLIKTATKTTQPGRADPKKPPKFSYVVEGLLAGMGRPTQHGHMQFLCDNGFKYLVTLTLNKPRAILEYPGEGLEWVHIPIQDETPPSVEQIKQFVALVDRAKEEKTSVGVHCAWGRGRTGTMLACYLAKAGSLSVEAAVEEIRRLRPGSIDTEKQMDSLRKYVASLRS